MSSSSTSAVPMLMPHSFLPVKFEPERSAYWLPKSGRLAAAKLPTHRFWGLRISFTDDPDDNIWPPWLFVVSSFPSPYPVENASCTLGPRVTFETGAIVGKDVDLLTTAPIPTKEERSSWPLYLHLVPALPINVRRSSGLKYLWFTLTEDSVRTFHDGVARCVRSADEKIREALATHGFEKIKNGWYAHREDTDDVGWMFGEPSDPHKYVFDFGFDIPDHLSSTALPAFERPSSVYDELMLYNQLCKDYKWRGVDYAVEWLQNMRASVDRGWVANPKSLAAVLPKEPCLDDNARIRAMELAAMDNPHARIACVLKEKHVQRMDAAANVDLDSTHSSDSSVLFLPWRFSRIPYRYPVVPFSRPKVIAFDIFGTILNREKALELALTPWFAQSPIRNFTTLPLVVDRFVTLEALAERNAQNLGSPISLATCARCALVTLGRELFLDVDEHSTIFTETLRRILCPLSHRDVEPAIVALKQRGYTLVCLPTHSATTMQQLRPFLPPVFADSDIVQMWTGHSSTHFVAPAPFLFPLQPFCESIVKGALQPSEIIVVSSSVGRVLHAAINARYSTVWVRRPGYLESAFHFVVGADANSSPVPSLAVTGLMDLVAML